MRFDDHPDDEYRSSGAPLPPEDRLWRHPAELGPDVRPSPTTPAAPPPVRRPAGARVGFGIGVGLAAGVALIGAVVALGALWLNRPAPGGGDGPSITVASAAAAPADTLLRTVADRRGRARLGVTVTDAAPGARITDLDPTGAAAVAGLRVDDLVVAVDGQAVSGVDDLVAVVGDHAPGDHLTVEVRRATGSVLVEVVVGAA